MGVIVGSVGVTLFLLSPHAPPREDIKLNAVNLSTKKFPGSMVVLNYLRVSVISNSGVLLLFSSQKCSVLGGGIRPLGLTFPGALYHSDGTLWSAEIL